jgi:hypothetical protein
MLFQKCEVIYKFNELLWFCNVIFVKPILKRRKDSA